jgi:hypothetical protein
MDNTHMVKQLLSDVMKGTMDGIIIWRSISSPNDETHIIWESELNNLPLRFSEKTKSLTYGQIYIELANNDMIGIKNSIIRSLN